MTTGTDSTTATPASSSTPRWDEFIGAFAKTIGMPLADVNKTLEALVGEPSDENLVTLANRDFVSDDDFVAAFSTKPKGKVKQAMAQLRAALAPPPAAPPATQASSAAPATSVMLPTLPDDDSFLAALRVGGTPKVSATEVAAAVRIFVAHQTGIDSVPDTILELMEARAEDMDEPIGDDFADLRRLVIEKRYADILEAVNLKGFTVTEKHRKKLAAKMVALPGILKDFQTVVTGWYDTWMAQISNPAMFMQTITAGMGGGSALLSGMAAPPDTGSVLAAAEGVINGFNRMFAGYGRAAARAMGYDAVRVKQILADPRLPAAIGKTNREEMLKTLGVGVSSDLVRFESDVGRYVLAIYQVGENQVPTDQLPVYLSAVANLGKQINWDRLTGTNSTRPTTPAGRSTSGGSETVAPRHRVY